MAGEKAGTGANPKVINGFEILDKLGQGAMGAVFKARQISLDRIVALKILPPSIAKDQTFIERFMREARSSAKLNHPNAVQGIDVGQDPATGLYYFAMELVDGPTLKQVLQDEGKLDEVRVLEIALDVTKALEAAEKISLVHRDIKPDNILLTANGTPKLADLGLAKQTNSDGEDAGLTQTGKAIGTPFYMAPEQVRGHNDKIDTRTDLYALGATLFHLLTGHPPFQGSTSAEIMSKHLTEKPPLAHREEKSVSEATGRLLARLMEKEPAKRVGSAAELVGQIEKILFTQAGKRGAKGATTGKLAPIGAKGTTGPRAPIKGTTTGPRVPVKGTGTGPRASVSERDRAEPAAGGSMLAIGGVAAAVLLGGMAFLLMGKGGSKPETEARRSGSSEDRREQPSPVRPPQPVKRSEPATVPEAAKTASAGTETQPAVQEAPQEALSPMQAFAQLVRFEGLDAADKAGRAARIQQFLTQHGETDVAIRARQLLAELGVEESDPAAAPAATAQAVPAEPAPSPEPAAPAPRVDEAAAEAAFARFAANFLEALRAGALDKAKVVLSQAQADGALKPLAEPLAQAPESFKWLQTLDAALALGAEKLKDADVFTLRLAVGNPMRVGKKVEMQVAEVKDGQLYIKQQGMELPLAFAKLHPQTRMELSEQGLGEEAGDRLAAALGKVLSLGGESASADDARAAVEAARKAGAAEPAVALLSRFVEVAEVGAAEVSAGAAWKLLVRLHEEQKWKELRDAGLKFLEQHGQSEQRTAHAEELEKLLAKAMDELAKLEGLYYDFDSPASFAAFQQGVQIHDEGAMRGNGSIKGAVSHADGKLVAKFQRRGDGPRSWTVLPLEFRIPRRNWDGDWEVRYKFRHVKPGGENDWEATTALIFHWGERDANGFRITEVCRQRMLSGDFSVHQHHGLPIDSGIWRFNPDARRNFHSGRAYDFRYVRQGDKLTVWVDGQEAGSGEIPPDLARQMAGNPVRIGFEAVAHDSGALEIDDFYFGPPRGDAAAKPAVTTAVAPTPAAPAAQAPASTPAAGAGIDLLARSIPEKDSAVLGWKRDGTDIVSPNAQYACLALPYAPPEEYDLTVEFTREQGTKSIDIILPFRDRAFLFLLDGFDQRITGFMRIGGKDTRENSTRVELPEPLHRGRRYKVSLRVRQSGVEALLDGRPITRYAGDWSDVTLDKDWKLTANGVVALGCFDTTIRFHRAEITPVSGAGRWLRDEKAVEAVAAAPAGNTPATAEKKEPAAEERRPLTPTLEMTMWLSFDEGRGNQAIDRAKRGSDGVFLGGTVPYEKSQWDGFGVKLDGKTHIGINNSRPLIFGGNSFSIGAWVKTERDGAIMSKTSVRGNFEAFSKAFYISRGNLRFTGSMGGGEGEDGGGPGGRTRITDGQWHHVAATYDWSTRNLILYVDGQEDGRQNNTTLGSDIVQHVVRIGMGGQGVPRAGGLVGMIDEVVHYRRALSPDEVKALAAKYEMPGK
ncbi:MAG: protein kinase [Planctomycetes bacterium]|nr:protein kinase [Planctomycetota bacterium]